MFLNEAAQEVSQKSVHDFHLAIRLWAKCGRESKHCPHHAPESFLEIAGEADVSIGDNVVWDPVKADHLIEE